MDFQASNRQAWSFFKIDPSFGCTNHQEHENGNGFGSPSRGLNWVVCEWHLNVVQGGNHQFMAGGKQKLCIYIYIYIYIRMYIIYYIDTYVYYCILYILYTNQKRKQCLLQKQRTMNVFKKADIWLRIQKQTLHICTSKVAAPKTH